MRKSDKERRNKEWIWENDEVNEMIVYHSWMKTVIEVLQHKWFGEGDMTNKRGQK